MNKEVYKEWIETVKKAFAIKGYTRLVQSGLVFEDSGLIVDDQEGGHICWQFLDRVGGFDEEDVFLDYDTDDVWWENDFWPNEPVTHIIALYNEKYKGGTSRREDCKIADKHLIIPFLNWLTNDSPWADIFLTKDAETIYYGGIVVSTQFPSDMMVSGLIMFRSSYEKTERRFSVWNMLVNDGVDGLLAWFVSGFVDTAWFNGKRWWILGGDGDHELFEDYEDEYVGVLRNIINNNPKFERTTYYEDAHYGGLNASWEHSDALETPLIGHALNIKSYHKDVIEYENVFGEKIKRNVIKDENLLDVLREFIEDLKAL